MMSNHRSPMRAMWTALLLAAWCGAPALAHGGRWIGPSLPPPPPIPSSPPTFPTSGTGTRGPATMPGTNARTPAPVPGGITPAGATTPEWETWWEFNWEWILDARRAAVPLAEGETSTHAPRTPSRQSVRATLLPLLLRESHHSNAEIRSAAVLALGKTALVEAAEPVLTALKDPVRDVRESALLALALLHQPRALEVLEATLLDESESTRQRCFAAASLGLMGSHRAAQPLLALVDPPRAGKRFPRSLRIAALLGLAASGDRSAAPRIARVLEGSSERDGAVRAMACAALGRVGDRASLSTLRGALADRDQRVREAAALALGPLAGRADREISTALQRAAGADPDPTVKSFALLSLGRIGGAEARTFLRTNLDRRHRTWNPPVRPYAFLALGLCGAEGDGALLAYHFKKHRAASERGAAAIALGLLKHKPAAPALLGELASTRNRTLFNNLAIALAMMRERAITSRMLATLRRDRSPERVRAALIALALIDEPSHLHLALARMRRERSSVLKGAIGQAIAAVADARQSDTILAALDARKRPPESLRALLVIALGRIAGPQPLPAFCALRRDQWFLVGDATAQEIMSIL